jgi:hypothetical protein
MSLVQLSVLENPLDAFLVLVADVFQSIIIINFVVVGAAGVIVKRTYILLSRSQDSSVV